MSVNPRWDAIFKEREWGLQPSPGVILLFAFGFYFTDRKSIKVLDLGCGTGANLWYLACEGYQVYGIDGSPTAIEHSWKMLDKLCPAWHGELKTGDMASLPWPEDTFDVVIDVNSSTCNTIDEMKVIFKEVDRVLKPEGLFHSQIFSQGTDIRCLAPGTSASIVPYEILPQLYGEFGVPLIEQRSRPHMDIENAVYEWIITARTNKDNTWKKSLEK